MRFFSDNAAAAHPAVIEAIARSNRLDTAYDGDALSQKLDSVFSDLFETEVRAFWVTTGTAANCLALAALCPPYGGIICHRDAHIEVDEAGAPGFFADGAKLMLVDGPGAKVAPEAVDAAVGRIRKDVHQVQPKALSITNATEYGLTYTAADTYLLTEARYRNGIESFLGSLDAQRSYYSAQRTLVLSRLETATNLVELYRSLGGDSLLTTESLPGERQ